MGSASNEPADLLENNDDSHTITVRCPALTATKDADGIDPEVVSAGEPIGFTITVTNSALAGTGTALNVELEDLLPFGDGVDWDIESDDPAGSCEIQGDPPAETLVCAFGDLDPGDSASVHVVSDTTQESCTTYPNEASITATNHPELTPDDSVTVECPGLNIAKIATDDDHHRRRDRRVRDRRLEHWAWPRIWRDVARRASVPLGSDIEWIEVADPSDECEVVDNVLDCNFGTLGVTTMEESLARVTVAAETDRDDCGLLDNTAFADSTFTDRSRQRPRSSSTARSSRSRRRTTRPNRCSRGRWWPSRWKSP